MTLLQLYEHILVDSFILQSAKEIYYKLNRSFYCKSLNHTLKIICVSRKIREHNLWISRFQKVKHQGHLYSCTIKLLVLLRIVVTTTNAFIHYNYCSVTLFTVLAWFCHILCSGKNLFVPRSRIKKQYCFPVILD